MATAREHDADDRETGRSMRKQNLDVGFEFRSRALEGHSPAGSLETIEVRRARKGAPILDRKSVERAIAPDQPIVSDGDHRLARPHQFAVEDQWPIVDLCRSRVRDWMKGAVRTHRARVNCRSSGRPWGERHRRCGDSAASSVEALRIDAV